MATTKKRLAVIGGGPVGLEVAVRAVKSGKWQVELLERGAPFANVRSWGHVKLFSNWSLNASAPGLEALTELGVAQPIPDAFPTGNQYCEAYLQHLWSWLVKNGATVRSHANVVSISRGQLVKGDLKGRSNVPFRLLVCATTPEIEASDGSKNAINSDGFSV